MGLKKGAARQPGGSLFKNGEDAYVTIVNCWNEFRSGKAYQDSDISKPFGGDLIKPRPANWFLVHELNVHPEWMFKYPDVPLSIEYERNNNVSFFTRQITRLKARQTNKRRREKV